MTSTSKFKPGDYVRLIFVGPTQSKTPAIKLQKGSVFKVLYVKHDTDPYSRGVPREFIGIETPQFGSIKRQFFDTKQNTYVPKETPVTGWYLASRFELVSTEDEEDDLYV